MTQTAAVSIRTIVVGIVRNVKGEYLICKMPDNRGVFPAKWGLPGGGIEKGEKMEAALRRELREELCLEVDEIKPLFFKDGEHQKLFADGSQRRIYMIFLLFSCVATTAELQLSDEFIEYAWVPADSLLSYDLNPTTIETFRQAGIIT
jgi:nucleoside triphosphatase